MDRNSSVNLQTSRTNGGRTEDEVKSDEAVDEDEEEEDVANDAEELSASSSDEDSIEAALKQFDANYARPPHRWAALKAIRNREYGDKHNASYHDYFR